MTVAELRKALELVPDDAEVRIADAHAYERSVEGAAWHVRAYGDTFVLDTPGLFYIRRVL